jgi:phosphoribosylformylglycinamidine cyclo-ligase
MDNMVDSWSYSKSGVDLSAHREMHRYVLEKMRRLEDKDIEPYGSFSQSVIMDGKTIALHVDGVGTKTIVLKKLGKLRIAGWDCVAVNVNDVACDNVEPVALLDYIALPSSDTDSFREVIDGIIDAAGELGVKLIGGETAIMPDLVNGIDVVCIIVGYKKGGGRYRARVGDLVVGVNSWGLHANGYTLARKIVESTLGGYDVVIDGVNIGEELSKPTPIYSRLVLEALGSGYASAAAHITGGSFYKAKRILPEGADMVIKAPEPPPIFKVLMKLGNVSPPEMYRVFNMGIGLVLTTSRDSLGELNRLIEEHGFHPYVIGEIVEGTGLVHVITPYGDVVEY